MTRGFLFLGAGIKGEAEAIPTDTKALETSAALKAFGFGTSGRGLSLLKSLPDIVKKILDPASALIVIHGVTKIIPDNLLVQIPTYLSAAVHGLRLTGNEKIIETNKKHQIADKLLSGAFGTAAIGNHISGGDPLLTSTFTAYAAGYGVSLPLNATYGGVYQAAQAGVKGLENIANDPYHPLHMAQAGILQPISTNRIYRTVPTESRNTQPSIFLQKDFI